MSPFLIEKKRTRVHVPSTEDAKVHISGSHDFDPFLRDLAELDAKIASVYAAVSTPLPSMRTKFADDNDPNHSDPDTHVLRRTSPVLADSSNDWGLGALAQDVK